jgi:hypothetical protein
MCSEMQTEESMIAVPDLDTKRCVNAMRRLKRKGFDTSRVWIYSRKDKETDAIKRALILPASYKEALTPMMQEAAMIYNGTLR